MYMHTYALEVILFRTFLSLIYAELANINFSNFCHMLDAKFTLVVCLLIPISHFVIFLIHLLSPFRSVQLRILKLVTTVCITDY